MKPSSGVKPPIPSMMRSPFSRELTRTVRRLRARAHSAASASPESIRGLRTPPPCGGTRSGKLFSLLERRSRQAGRVHAGQPHPGELQKARHQLGMKSFLRVNHRKIAQKRRPEGNLDRKSTRLNSSHRCISYAVFCLKKKTREYCAV